MTLADFIQAVDKYKAELQPFLADYDGTDDEEVQAPAPNEGGGNDRPDDGQDGGGGGGDHAAPRRGRKSASPKKKVNISHLIFNFLPCY